MHLDERKSATLPPGSSMGPRNVLQLLFGEKWPKLQKNLTTKAREKILRIVLDVCLNKFKNNHFLFHKISHSFLLTTKLFTGKTSSIPNSDFVVHFWHFIIANRHRCTSSQNVSRIKILTPKLWPLVNTRRWTVLILPVEKEFPGSYHKCRLQDRENGCHGNPPKDNLSKDSWPKIH
jgi:hypothetical protein